MVREGDPVSTARMLRQDTPAGCIVGPGGKALAVLVGDSAQVMWKAWVLVVIHPDRIVARIGRRRVGVADAREVAVSIVAVGIDAPGGIGHRLQALCFIVGEAERAPGGVGQTLEAFGHIDLGRPHAAYELEEERLTLGARDRGLCGGRR